MGKKGGSSADSKQAVKPTTAAKPNPQDGFDVLETKLNQACRLQWSTRVQRVQQEVVVFVFVMAHLMVQNFNVYQLNLYNYNQDLMFFTTFTLFKHVVAATVGSPDGASHYNFSLVAVRAAAQVVLGIAITSFGSLLVVNHQPLALLLLLLPWLVHFGLFRDVFVVEAQKCADELERASLLIKMQLYRVLESIYYAALLPLYFVKHDYLYYDTTRPFIVVLYLIPNMAILFICQLLTSEGPELQLISLQLQKHGSLLRQGTGNQTESNEPHWLLVVTLKALFANPVLTISLIIVVQLIVTISQLGLVLLYKQWIWIFAMLVCNLLLLHWLRSTQRLIAHQQSR